jgi:uncharacterized cupredoxin-like copper-binding protein
MTRTTRILSLAAAAALALGGCGGDDGENDTTTPAASGGATIRTELGEWTVEPAETTAAAGTVTFEAANVGKVEHELEVVKTETKADALELDGPKAKVDGEERGEVGGIAAGESKDLKVDLDAGHYILLCNLPGHYQQGMRADFTVE